MVVSKRTQVVAGFSSRRSGFSHWAVRATFVLKKVVLRQVFFFFKSDHFGFPLSVLIPSVLRTCLSSGAGTLDTLKFVSDSRRPRLLAKRNWFCSLLDQALAFTRGNGSALIDWMHSEEKHDLNFLPIIVCVISSRRLRRAWHLAPTGDGGDAYRVLVARPQGKIPLGRPRRRWEDNIRIDLQEKLWGWTG